PGQILARLNHHLGDADFSALLERIAQKHVGFVAAFLRFEIIRFVKEHRIDLVKIDKVLDVHRLGRFEINALKIFVFQHDVFSFFILVAFDNLVPRNLPAVLFRDAFVIHGTQVALAKETKLELRLPSRRIQGDGNVNQTETDAPFPNCTHTKLFRTCRLIWASEGAHASRVFIVAPSQKKLRGELELLARNAAELKETNQGLFDQVVRARGTCCNADNGATAREPIARHYFLFLMQIVMFDLVVRN